MSQQQRKGGHAPFGYIWQDGELVIVPDEAAVVRELFDLFLIHQRKRTVAKLLNAKGYRTRVGKLFQYSTVSRILSNPTMKGKRKASYREKGSGKSIVRELSVKPIVPVELWDQVNAIIADYAGTQKRKPAQDIFVGRVFCDCDQTMEILSKSHNYSCHRCKQEIAIADIHEIFESTIADMPFPQNAELNVLSDQADSAPAIRSRIRQVKRYIDKLFELHSSEAIPTEAFKERHDMLSTRLAQLEGNLAAQDKQEEAFPESLLDYWKSTPVHKQQLLVDTLLKRITITSSVASTTFYSLFSFARQGSESAL